MIIPTKYEQLDSSALVLGAKILKRMRAKYRGSIEKIYSELFFDSSNNQYLITTEKFNDIILFLQLSDLIQVDIENFTFQTK